MIYEDPQGRRPVEERLRQLAGDSLRNKESRVFYNAILQTIERYDGGQSAAAYLAAHQRVWFMQRKKGKAEETGGE